MSYDKKPASISQDTYEAAGNASLFLEEKKGQVEVFDAGGYIFPRQVTQLDPSNAEEALKDAIAHPFPDPSYYKR